MSNKLLNIFVTLLLICGIALILYPSTSNYINSINQSKAIANYINNTNTIDDQTNLEIINKANELTSVVHLVGVSSLITVIL